MPGALRNEAVALLAGSGLAAALGLALVWTLIRRRLLRQLRASPTPRLWEYAADRSSPLPLCELKLAAPAGVSVYRRVRGAVVELSLASGTRRHLVSSRIDTAVDERLVLHGDLPGRGLYRPVLIRLLIGDPLRLLRVVHTVVPPATVAPVLRCLPGTSRASGTLRPAARGDGKRQDWLSMERSDELIEARPYVPGDDTRRINWKAYAHSGDLFVRIGEELPPPSRSALLILRATTALDDAAGDRLVEAGLTTADHLERDGLRVTVLLDGTMQRTLGGPERARRVLAALTSGGRLLAGAERGVPGLSPGPPAAGPALVLELDAEGHPVTRNETWSA